MPVQIAEITKSYGGVKAIDRASLSVRAGEFVTLLGPSGSGKTTLLMMIAGFSRPDAGSIRVGGQEIVRLPPHRRNIGMVFQNYALFPHMTVGENIAYPLRVRRASRDDIGKRVNNVLELMRLPGCADRRVDQLSGGQRQRVALARAIVFEPRILLMDEPLSALDKQLRERMQIELRRLHDTLGMTTIAVTHDQREALTMSDRIAILDHGKLVQFASPVDLYERPSTRFVAEFIGESCFLPVTVKNGVASYADQVLRLAEPPPHGGAQVQLLVRPEKLDLAGGAVGAGDHNRFEGHVADAVFQGDSMLLTVRLALGHEIHARLPNRRMVSVDRPERNSPIALVMHAQDSRLLPKVL
jgi:putative spermidine/putrescine transport system ATP-binding protein